MRLKQPMKRRALSYVEIVAVVTLVGIIGAIAMSRLVGGVDTARSNVCNVNQGDIEVQAQLWFRNKGSWPNSSLSDIGADANYFPGSLPNCPVDGSSYTIDTTTGKVNGHSH